MKRFAATVLSAVVFFVYGYAQTNVGIGTATPSALMHIHAPLGSDNGLLVTGYIDGGVSVVPNFGAGTRLMFYPGKAAFRAGHVNATQWNDVNVGLGSVAFGLDTRASGSYSTALGAQSEANGTASTAFGASARANGSYSTATGIFTTAGGIASTAMGYNTIASGHYSVAIGKEVSTNNQTGAFFFGDSNPNDKGLRNIGFANQIAMRFNGGYYFISSDVGSDIGVRVSPGGNSWSALSDVRLKENFLPVNGEDVLKKIAAFKLVSWNYKGQDPKTFRHYGPMAQEFFAAFGTDKLGTIGCDTLINQHDFLGVNLIAIQALEKRTTDLQKENDALQKKNGALEARLQKLERMVEGKK